MNSPSLQTEDQEAIESICNELKKVTTPLIKLDNMNTLFQQALNIAEKYRNDHPFTNH